MAMARVQPSNAAALRIVVAAALALPLFGLHGFPARAQEPDAAPAQEAGEPAPAEEKLSKEKLAQLVAPIALYPDPLLSQVLMASTYPLEIVQASRWVKANSKLKGKPLEEALLSQPWDPSIKSLTAFPDVLKMMNEKLDWTQQIGDAFLAQQSDVLAAVQSLRERADAEGSLKTTKQQKVVKSQSYISIEPKIPRRCTCRPTIRKRSRLVAYPDYPPSRMVSTRLCQWPWHLVGIRCSRRPRFMGHRELAELGRRYRPRSLQPLQPNQSHRSEMAAQRRPSKRRAIREPPPERSVPEEGTKKPGSQPRTVPRQGRSGTRGISGRWRSSRGRRDSGEKSTRQPPVATPRRSGRGKSQTGCEGASSRQAQ